MRSRSESAVRKGKWDLLVIAVELDERVIRLARPLGRLEGAVGLLLVSLAAVDSDAAMRFGVRGNERVERVRIRAGETKERRIADQFLGCRPLALHRGGPARCLRS